MSRGGTLLVGAVLMLVRLALALYPPDFRREVGASMLRDFRARGEDRLDTGILPFVAWGVASASSLISTGAVEWWDRLASPTKLSAVDIRGLFRGLLRRSSYSVAVVATLAIALSANAVVFAVVRGVLLEPLPYSEPDRIVTVWSDWTDAPRTWVSAEEFANYVQESSTLADAAAFFATSVDLTEPGDPERVPAAGATPNALEVLGLAPVIGRTFTWAEADAGEAVVLIGYELWQRRFGGDPGAVGRLVSTGGFRNRIIGVLPRGFGFPQGYGRNGSVDLLYPYFVDLEGSVAVPPMGGNHGLMMIGRLAEAATVASARTELNAIASRLSQQGVYPADWRFRVLVRSAEEEVVGEARPAIHVLWATGLFVLLAACANLANLVLARFVHESGVMSIRRAIGARAGLLVGLVLAEVGILTVAASVLALLLAGLFLDTALAWSPWDLPRAAGIALDGSVLLYTLVLASVSAAWIAFGPVMRLLRARHAEPRRAPGRHGGRVQEVQRLLVVGQAGLAMMLLIGAGLMGRTVLALTEVDPGFSERSGLTFRMNLAEIDYPDGESVRTLYRSFVDRLRTLRGVENAAAVRVLPLGTIGTTGARAIGGPMAESFQVEFQVVSSDYFRTLGIPVVRGRTFLPDDTKDSDELVINEAMARLWGEQNPLGARVFTMGDTTTVIGIVQDVAQNGVLAEARPQAYRLLRQVPDSWIGAARGLNIVVVGSLPAVELERSARSALGELAPGIPVLGVRPLAELVAETYARERFLAVFVGLAGAAAMLLAVVGLQGVLTYSVELRTHEIGVRMALGAKRRAVVAGIVGHGLAMVATGVVVGWVAALAATRVLGSFLYGVPANDPVTFVLAGVTFMGVGIVASCLPAWRAARLDPVRSLRVE